MAVCWADIPGLSSWVDRWLCPWQQCWQQWSTRLQGWVICRGRATSQLASSLSLFITYAYCLLPAQANFWSGKVPDVNDPYTLAATKHDLVKSVSFGQRVAEEERDDLASYFVETEQWRRVWTGDVDVVSRQKAGVKAQSIRC